MIFTFSSIYCKHYLQLSKNWVIAECIFDFSVARYREQSRKRKKAGKIKIGKGFLFDLINNDYWIVSPNSKKQSVSKVVFINLTNISY